MENETVEPTPRAVLLRRKRQRLWLAAKRKRLKAEAREARRIEKAARSAARKLRCERRQQERVFAAQINKLQPTPVVQRKTANFAEAYRQGWEAHKEFIASGGKD